MVTDTGRGSAVSKKKPRNDDDEQSKLFIEKARELGAKDDDKAADELMRRLAQKAPEPRKKSE